jgi:hypothetical protein
VLRRRPRWHQAVVPRAQLAPLAYMPTPQVLPARDALEAIQAALFSARPALTLLRMVSRHRRMAVAGAAQGRSAAQTCSAVRPWMRRLT